MSCLCVSSSGQNPGMPACEKVYIPMPSVISTIPLPMAFTLLSRIICIFLRSWRNTVAAVSPDELASLRFIWKYYKREADNESVFICWFISQITAMTRTGLDWRQEPGTSSGFFIGSQGPKYLDHPALFFPGRETRKEGRREEGRERGK